MVVTTGPIAPKKETLTSETVLEVQEKVNLSDRSMLKLRAVWSKHGFTVKGDTAKILARRAKILSPFFDVEKKEFQITNKDTKEIETVLKDVVFCKDTKIFEDLVADVRKLVNERLNKMGIDSGRKRCAHQILFKQFSKM